jgi:hypothetical protein
MNETFQQILTGIAVAGAVLYLVLRARSKKGGKSGCACGTKTPLK